MTPLPSPPGVSRGDDAYNMEKGVNAMGSRTGEKPLWEGPKGLDLHVNAKDVDPVVGVAEEGREGHAAPARSQGNVRIRDVRLVLGVTLGQAAEEIPQ